MDIVSLLPIEVGRYIFKYLTARELGQCLQVSKRWRSIANDDLLWKKLCKDHHVTTEDPPDTPICESDVLCRWALVWNGFAKSPLFRWYMNEYETLPFNYQSRKYMAFSFHENNFSAYSEVYNNLDVYSVTRVNDRTKIKLTTSINLCFPMLGNSRLDLHMSDNYIVASKANIVLIFKKNGSDFDLYKAINISLTVEFADSDLYTFVDIHYDASANNFEMFGIIDNFVWIDAYIYETCLAIDVTSNSVRNIFTFSTSMLRNNFFITWEQDEESIIRVYDREGNILVMLEDVLLLDEVDVNKCVLSTVKGMPEGNNLVEAWALDSGEVIFSKDIESAWSVLHPNKPILFTLEAVVSTGFYSLSAWNLIVGEIMWNYVECPPIRSGVVISQLKIDVVGQKYVLIRPTPKSSNNYYLIHIDTGSVLYNAEAPFALCKLRSDYISDSVWFSLCGDTLVVRAYL